VFKNLPFVGLPEWGEWKCEKSMMALVWFSQPIRKFENSKLLKWICYQLKAKSDCFVVHCWNCFSECCLENKKKIKHSSHGPSCQTPARQTCTCWHLWCWVDSFVIDWHVSVVVSCCLGPWLWSKCLHTNGHCRQFVEGGVEQLVDQTTHGSMDVN